MNEKHIKGCIRLGIEGGRIPASAMNATVDETLAKWKLLKNGVPTNGAAMLFSNNIDEYPQFRLRMARFLGTDKNEFIDNQRAEGNFFDLLDAGIAFLFKHLNLSGKITNNSLQREEHLEVPYKALREALINSLCHRQWEKYNLTNSIAIYDDRIEIANPGIFPPQITPETIKEPHESYPYNLKIAETLYKSTYLESWGSGAKRIIDACREQNVEEPTWSWDGGFITVTFKRPVNDILSNGTDNDTDNDTEITNVKLRQKKIIQKIKMSPTITYEKLAEQLNVSRPTIARDIELLTKSGKLYREGGAFGGKWVVIKDN